MYDELFGADLPVSILKGLTPTVIAPLRFCVSLGAEPNSTQRRKDAKAQ